MWQAKKSWTDNVKEWTSLTMPELLAHVQNRPGWRQTTALQRRYLPYDKALSRDQ